MRTLGGKLLSRGSLPYFNMNFQHQLSMCPLSQTRLRVVAGALSRGFSPQHAYMPTLPYGTLQAYRDCTVVDWIAPKQEYARLRIRQTRQPLHSVYALAPGEQASIRIEHNDAGGPCAAKSASTWMVKPNLMKPSLSAQATASQHAGFHAHTACRALVPVCTPSCE